MGRCIALLLVLACSSSTTPEKAKVEVTPREDPRGYVGKDALVDPAVPTWADPAERARFERARACFDKRATTWQHYPLRMIGNFVEENWCRGDRAELGCSGGNFRDQADTDWAEVGTLHYPKDWPAVFGVQVSAGHRPAEGWGAWFSFSSNGKTILGDGGSVGFGRTGDKESEFYIGTTVQWEIAESRFEVKNERDSWQLLDRVRVSPQALRDATLASWNVLSAQVLSALERGEVVECVYGEYKNDGIPPQCLRKVPIAADKVAKETARIKAKVAAIGAAFDADGNALHALLLGVAPIGCP